MSRLSLLSRKKLFLFDLDGVLYKGKEKTVLIGGIEVFKKIKKTGRKLFVLTNNSTDTTDTIWEKLVNFGFEVKREEILTSSYLAGLYMMQKFGKTNYFLVGEEGLEKELSRFGHVRAEDEKAELVVVGLDRFFNYEKLDAAVRVAMRTKKIIATHAARFYMYLNGPAVATGPILRAIEFGSGIRARVIGKPSPLMFRLSLKLAGCKKEEAVMIGDQVDTDIIGAQRSGIDSVLVLTGVDKSAAGTNALGALESVDSLLEYI